MEIFRRFTFDSAHRMPGFPEDHEYGRLHGHSYCVDIHVQGTLKEDHEWVMDIDTLSATVAPVIADLDHTYLNEIPGLEKPTCENIARWLWNRLKTELPGLSKLVIHRANAGGCIYQGHDTP